MDMFNESTFTKVTHPKPGLVKLRNLLNTPKFCTVCYETNVELQNLDDCPFMEETEACSDLSLRQILEEIFGDARSRIILSNYVCRPCQLKLLYTFTFIRSTNNRAANFEYYLTQLDSETIDLLNCMDDNPTCANAVIVLEDPPPKDQELEEVEKFRWNSFQPRPRVVQFVERPRHIVTKNYVCEYCSKEFSDKKFLLAHLSKNGLCKTKASLDKTREVPFYGVDCPKCNKRPCVHDKFIKHFLEHKTDKVAKIKCLKCSFTSTTLKPLIYHVEKKHMEELADNCELCGKMFYMREQYFSHFETFHQNYRICSFCCAVIPSDSIISHESDCAIMKKNHFCSKCPSTFTSDLEATIHFMSHADVPKKPNQIVLKRCYSCPLCSETFNGKLKLQKHCNDAHGVESYKNSHCQFCDIKFPTKQAYLLHMREMQHFADINPNHSYRHKCEYCDYTARHAFILKTHMNRYHLKVMPFQCDICNKRFLDKRKLKAHIDRHMGAGKRICTSCGDTLGSSTALIKHMRLHTGERPYPCNLCDVSLNSASERKFHILRKHTEKTHPCPLCETMFHTPYFVRRHIQQVHWKRKEKFDHTKLEGLGPEHYELFRDRRMVVV